MRKIHRDLISISEVGWAYSVFMLVYLVCIIHNYANKLWGTTIKVDFSVEPRSWKLAGDLSLTQPARDPPRLRHLAQPGIFRGILRTQAPEREGRALGAWQHRKARPGGTQVSRILFQCPARPQLAARALGMVGPEEAAGEPLARSSIASAVMRRTPPSFSMVYFI